MSIEHGRTTLFDVAAPHRGLYVNLERDHAGMKRRMKQVKHVLGLPADAGIEFMAGRGQTLEGLREPIARAIEAKGIEVVYLDSISRAGGDLNDNLHVNRMVDMLNNLCPTWFAIAHTARQDDTHIFGSVHFDAGADLVIQMQAAWKPQRIGVVLRLTKANDTALGVASDFVLEFDEGGLAQVRGREATEFLQLSAGVLPPIDDAVIDYLNEYGSGNPNDIANATGHTRGAVTKLIQRNRTVFVYDRKEGSKVFYRMKL